MMKGLIEMREYQDEMREEELRITKLKAEGAWLILYSVEVKKAGSTHQYITTAAPNALIAIDNVIAGLEVAPRNEYVARKIKEDLLSWSLQSSFFLRRK